MGSRTIAPVAVPYTGGIPGGLSDGSEIEIQGVVPHHAHDGFAVNLAQGPQVEPNTLLHFNPRFRENTLVLNTMQNGGWGGEERHRQPFHKGRPFDLRIIVKPQMFKMKVNGSHIADFGHRLPKDMAQFIMVSGDVSINYIKFNNGHRHHGPPAGAVPGMPAAPPSYGSQPIYNPPVPFMNSVPGGLFPGRMISISGIPFPNASGFAVNLQSGNFEGCDIAFHFNPRIRGNDGSINTLVRNSYQGGRWGGEERGAPYFPFMPNANFDLLILVEQHAFKVAVNNQHLLEFNHRLPVGSVNTLNISGDLRLTQIRYQ